MHSATSASSLQGAQPSQVLLWNIAEGSQLQGVYHATTQLPDGRLSILVDPGAFTNLCGVNNARRMQAAGNQAGYASDQWYLDTPMSIMGVGEGTQFCTIEASVPFANKNADGSVGLNIYEAPLVHGSGADLPALLGLKSIKSKQGVLDTGRA